MRPTVMSKSKSGPDESLVTLFTSIGLTRSKAIEAAKSPKAATALSELIGQFSLIGSLDEKQASLVAAFAVLLSKSVGVGEDGRRHVVSSVINGKLKSTDQVAGTAL